MKIYKVPQSKLAARLGAIYDVPKETVEKILGGLGRMIRGDFYWVPREDFTITGLGTFRNYDGKVSFKPSKGLLNHAAGPPGCPYRRARKGK